nr:MAG TPA: hypothetical protein [Caudoviricetes sp.]
MKLLSKNKLVMQALVGEVEEDPDGVDKICIGMNQNPIINFKDGTSVIFSWEELCEMAANFKKKEEANEKSPAATKQQD